MMEFGRHNTSNSQRYACMEFTTIFMAWPYATLFVHAATISLLSVSFCCWPGACRPGSLIGLRFRFRVPDAIEAGDAPPRPFCPALVCTTGSYARRDASSSSDGTSISCAGASPAHSGSYFITSDGTASASRERGAPSGSV